MEAFETAVSARHAKKKRKGKHKRQLIPSRGPILKDGLIRSIAVSPNSSNTLTGAKGRSERPLTGVRNSAVRKPRDLRRQGHQLYQEDRSGIWKENRDVTKNSRDCPQSTAVAVCIPHALPTDQGEVAGELRSRLERMEAPTSALLPMAKKKGKHAAWPRRKARKLPLLYSSSSFGSDLN